ncbi:MAG TPA: hypothetical protein VMG58_08345, partial [Candidatus Sulfotelmatobacter sp.]|nr:hypothetical protein [Candidatus Sulfotelmatobacter sp.]
MRYQAGREPRSGPAQFDLRELRAAGLTTAYRQPVATDTFDFQRLRNVYHIEPVLGRFGLGDRLDLGERNKVGEATLRALCSGPRPYRR